jgi:hypothetical protein
LVSQREKSTTGANLLEAVSPLFSAIQSISETINGTASGIKCQGRGAQEREEREGRERTNRKGEEENGEEE